MDKDTKADGSGRMEKETLQEIRGLRGEVAQINRSQADLQTDQAAMLRDIHHMNLQMVDQAQSIKEMANAVVKLAAVSEKMDRANRDINELGEKCRAIDAEIKVEREDRTKCERDIRDKIHAAAKDHESLAGIVSSNSREIVAGRWLFGSTFVLLLGNLIKTFIGD